jgi:uncharacterized protein (TIGR01777 family)
MKVVITGAGGFIGSHLKASFKKYETIPRNCSTYEITARLEGADAVINLAGAPIIKRWTKQYKRILWDSRIETTKRLVMAMNQTGAKYHLVSISATGIYPQGRPCNEKCPDSSDDFLGQLAKQWEKEAMRYNGPLTILRLGVVFGKEGGALAKMLPPFKMCLGGPIGRGEMITSWIDIDDLVQVFRFIIDNKLVGIFNAVSPHPVSNAEFTRHLASALRRPAFLPVPPPLLELLFGEAASVLTGSWEVYPENLMKAGFEFQYPTVKESIKHLLE